MTRIERDREKVQRRKRRAKLKKLQARDRKATNQRDKQLIAAKARPFKPLGIVEPVTSDVIDEKLAELKKLYEKGEKYFELAVSPIKRKKPNIKVKKHDKVKEPKSGAMKGSKPSKRRPPRVGDLQTKIITLEQFDCLVDHVEGDTAYVNLTSSEGQRLFGEYSAIELAKLGIHERRRFTCQTVMTNGHVEIRFQTIPDVEVTPDEEAAIDRELDDLISGGKLDGDY